MDHNKDNRLGRWLGRFSVRAANPETPINWESFQQAYGEGLLVSDAIPKEILPVRFGEKFLGSQFHELSEGGVFIDTKLNVLHVYGSINDDTALERLAILSEWFFQKDPFINKFLDKDKALVGTKLVGSGLIVNPDLDWNQQFSIDTDGVIKTANVYFEDNAKDYIDLTLEDGGFVRITKLWGYMAEGEASVEQEKRYKSMITDEWLAKAEMVHLGKSVQEKDKESAQVGMGKSFRV